VRVSSPVIQIARVYDPPKARGRWRVLVDRLWPRGVRKADLDFDRWARDLAPSDKLRRWFKHDPKRWDEFRTRYFAELEGKEEQLADLVASAGKRPILLLYGARDEKHNNAVALKEFLEKRRRRRKTKGA
jgi:uncharacterized protein YeaO (DUF488 family)